MKTEAQIRAQMKTYTDDERFHYKTATLHENAPLALIQLDMEARLAALAWVLGEESPKSRRGQRK